MTDTLAALDLTQVRVAHGTMRAPTRILRTLNIGAAPALVAGYAIANPGVEVIASAMDSDEVDAMSAALLEVLAAADPGVTKMRYQDRCGGAITLTNGSRVVCREPRRDGAGIKGLLPDLVWWCGEDMSDRARTELHEIVKP